jgi:polyisoprenoid-binding protein YceI
VALDATDLWTLDASDGELVICTGVAGRAARMGHRLIIAMTRWQVTVNWSGSEPAKPLAAELVVDVDSFDVLRGEGGVKGLSGPEKALARSHALKSLNASRFPEIRFTVEGGDEAGDQGGDTSDKIVRTGDGYRLTGTLQIRGKSREHVIDLRTEDLGGSWRMSAESRVRQTDFGVKPYSLLMGSVRVADEVTLSFVAARAKTEN